MLTLVVAEKISGRSREPTAPRDAEGAVDHDQQKDGRGGGRRGPRGVGGPPGTEGPGCPWRWRGPVAGEFTDIIIPLLWVKVEGPWMSRLRAMYGTDPRALFTIRILAGILLLFDIEMRTGMFFFDWYQLEMFYGPDGVRQLSPLCSFTVVTQDICRLCLCVCCSPTDQTLLATDVAQELGYPVPSPTGICTDVCCRHAAG